MKVRQLILQLMQLDGTAEILLEGRVKGEEFTVVSVGNGETIHGYMIVKAKSEPEQMKLPLSGNAFDEPKDSIGE